MRTAVVVTGCLSRARHAGHFPEATAVYILKYSEKHSNCCSATCEHDLRAISESERIRKYSSRSNPNSPAVKKRFIPPTRFYATHAFSNVSIFEKLESFCSSMSTPLDEHTLRVESDTVKSLTNHHMMIGQLVGQFFQSGKSLPLVFYD